MKHFKDDKTEKWSSQKLDTFDIFKLNTYFA